MKNGELLDGFAIVPVGANSGRLYMCKSHIYRSFIYDGVYHESIPDILTGASVVEWALSKPDDWEFVGDLTEKGVENG